MNSSNGASINFTPDSQISYSDAIKYWSSVPPTVDGVLGGFGYTSLPVTDARGSVTFIRKAMRRNPEFERASRDGDPRACDIGAGIGRVTRDVLSQVCIKVDLVEPVEPFADQIEQELEKANALEKLGTIYKIGMQDFTPQQGHYWIIWCQWCLGQLKDLDLVAFLRRCSAGLKKGGLIFVKENNATTDEDEFDSTDSSVTRSDISFRSIFQMSGLKLLMAEEQMGLIAGLYPVRTYALQPIDYTES
ncbi:uncharacterized protein V1516DRAFT_676061 [Lipomyces oligophaga]|uniref:uncharacterized protein n=1 Tax=Lipomyces oligophaga TaxID=45792 RepID=UPI0034CD8AC7